MPEDVANHFVFTYFATPVPGKLREFLDNDTTTRDKSYLNGLEITKGESEGLSMIIKTGMEVSQDCTVFNYGPPRPQKDLKPQYVK